MKFFSYICNRVVLDTGMCEAIKLPMKFFSYICNRVVLDTGMCAIIYNPKMNAVSNKVYISATERGECPSTDKENNET